MSVQTLVLKEPFYMIFRVFHLIWYRQDLSIISVSINRKFFVYILWFGHNCSSKYFFVDPAGPAANSEHGLLRNSPGNNTDRCSNSNSSFSVGYLFQNARPFTEPLLTEYPLLCLKYKFCLEYDRGQQISHFI